MSDHQGLGKYAVKQPNPGVVVGVLFSAWTIGFILADYVRVSERPHFRVVLVIALAVIGASLSSLVFATLSGYARKHVRCHPEEVEEGGYCPWAYLGGISVGVTLLATGIFIAYMAYSRRTDFPVWEIILLIGNVGVVSVTWWTHLAISERPAPDFSPQGLDQDMFVESLKLEGEFLRSIVGVMNQFVHLAGTGLLGIALFFVTKDVTKMPADWYLIVGGLVVWLSGVHLGITSPFMRRHGEIVRSLINQARLDIIQKGEKQARAPGSTGA